MAQEQTISGEELDRIGRLGENFFEKMCDKARLKWSRVEPDKTGKDYVIEFSLEPVVSLTSIDKRSAPTQILVQVKTILAKNQKASVALSVLERLAKDTRPAIIAILQIDADDEIVGMYFVHIIDIALERVLKALRLASTLVAPLLHKRSISFRTGQAEVVGLTRSEFYASMASLPSDGMHAYATNKIHQLETLGFSANRHSVKFTVSATPQDVADGFLALRPLPIENVIFSERRFDIDLPVETIVNATLHLSPTSQIRGTCLLQTTSHAEYLECMIDAEFMYVPEPLLGPGEFAMSARIKQGIFVIRPNSWSFQQSAEFDGDSCNTLKDWKDFIDIAAIIGTGSFSMTLRLQESDRSIVFKVDDPSAAYDTKIEMQYLHLLSLLQTVLTIARLKSTTFKLTDLTTQYKHLDLITKASQGLVATFTSSSADRSVPALRSVDSALICPVNIAGHWLGFFMAMTVSAETGDNETHWTGKQTRRAVIEDLSSDDIETSFEAFRERYCDLLGTQLAFVQKPGDFLSTEVGMMDLRAG